LTGIRVLLIDDQRESRESLAALLAQAGAKVRTAASGREALALLESAPGEASEVLVCDIAMPDEDGYAALKRIRAWEAQRPRPAARRPAVAISAYGEREDHLRALNEGFQTYLPKPVSPAELMLVISDAARPARPHSGKERAMPDKRKTQQPNDKDQQRAREANPQKPEREPEAPGGQNEGKGRQDAVDKTTRRGER
jgi:CheY-like chemotaxis protein